MINITSFVFFFSGNFLKVLIHDISEIWQISMKNEISNESQQVRCINVALMQRNQRILKGINPYGIFDLITSQGVHSRGPIDTNRS